MNDTLTSPEIPFLTEDEVSNLSQKKSAVLVSFHFNGTDNGVPKSGFDSRVVEAPEDVRIETASDVKTIADALANSEFANGRKYEGLEITIINLTRLPV